MNTQSSSSRVDQSADDGTSPGGPARTLSTLSPAERSRDRALFVVLTIVQIIVSMFAAFFELLNEMGFDACGERGPKSVCNYDLADALFPIELTSITVIAIATVAWATVRSVRGKRIWWLPLVAAGAAVAVSAVLVLTVYKMINLSPFSA